MLQKQEKKEKSFFIVVNDSCCLPLLSVLKGIIIFSLLFFCKMKLICKLLFLLLLMLLWFSRRWRLGFFEISSVVFLCSVWVWENFLFFFCWICFSWFWGIKFAYLRADNLGKKALWLKIPATSVGNLTYFDEWHSTRTKPYYWRQNSNQNFFSLFAFTQKIQINKVTTINLNKINF